MAAGMGTGEDRSTCLERSLLALNLAYYVFHLRGKGANFGASNFGAIILFLCPTACCMHVLCLADNIRLVFNTGSK